jgi:hypothetical protein
MRKFSAIALFCVPLAGCVGFSSDKAKVNNISQIASYERASQVQVGDSLQKLTQLMGEPSSIGLDESGKPYLRYIYTSIVLQTLELRQYFPNNVEIAIHI